MWWIIFKNSFYFSIPMKSSAFSTLSATISSIFLQFSLHIYNIHRTATWKTLKSRYWNRWISCRKSFKFLKIGSKKSKLKKNFEKFSIPKPRPYMDLNSQAESREVFDGFATWFLRSIAKTLDYQTRLRSENLATKRKFLPSEIFRWILEILGEVFRKILRLKSRDDKNLQYKSNEWTRLEWRNFSSNLNFHSCKCYEKWPKLRRIDPNQNQLRLKILVTFDLVTL